MAATKDMTTGSPAKLLFGFSLPLMLGNVFQQFYTIVDTIIVGRGVGMQALASIGAADWLNWLFLWMAAGMTQGFSILFAQHYGGKDEKSLHKSIGNAVILTIGAAVVLTAAGELVAPRMLALLKTLEDIVAGSLTYLRVMIGGLTVIMFYNLEASLLRALGDGRSPLTAMVIASCTNKTFKAGDACHVPGCNHQHWRDGASVSHQWVWRIVCSGFYGNKQIVWYFRDGGYFIRICNFYLCCSE